MSKLSIFITFLVITFLSGTLAINAADSFLVLEKTITNATPDSELFQNPYNLTFTPDNHLLVVDQKYHLQKFNLGGTKVEWHAKLPDLTGAVQFASVTVSDTGVIYFAHKVKGLFLLTPEGVVIEDIHPDQFSLLQSITFDPKDQLIYLADNSKIHLLKPDGEIIETFKDADLWQPNGITISPNSYLYVVDSNHQLIKTFDPWGELIITFGTSGVEPGQFQNPFGIAIDKHQRVYITNYSVKPEIPSSIEVFSADGKHLLHYPLVNLGSQPAIPTGIVLHDNRLYVTDPANNALYILRITDLETLTE